MTKKTILHAMAFAAAMALASSAAMGETQWEKNHPRRDQVNDRLAKQNKRINQEAKSGEISRQEAAKLHRQDRKIRKEERIMAGQNGGHITKGEQRVLNKQENKVSGEIGK